MSEDIEDEFYSEGDVMEGQSSSNVNINQESLDNKNHQGEGTVVHWKKVLPPKFSVVLVVGVGPRIDL